MFPDRNHNSDPKKAILRDVYVANLKMEGKFVETADLTAKGPVFRRILPVLLIVLVMASSSFTRLDPSLIVNPSSAARLNAPMSVPDRSADEVAEKAKGHYVSAAKNAEAVLDPIPMWDYVGPGDHGVEGFNLLLSEDDRVQLSSLFGLGVRTIVIDPGHGGRDPGALGAGGTMEKDITLDVGVRLKERLDRLNRFNVLLTRDTDKTISLADRVAFAKNKKADLFISLHVNSLPNKTMNIIETYYFGAPLNSDTLRLAELENKESHFLVGELDTILEDLGNTLKRQESARLATSIQASLFNHMRRQDSQVRDIGIKMAPFVVLSQIEVPSVLVEISCITKKKEEIKLASPKYRVKVASYIEEGIVTYLETQDFITLRGEYAHE